MRVCFTCVARWAGSTPVAALDVLAGDAGEAGMVVAGWGDPLATFSCTVTWKVKGISKLRT